MSIYSNIKTPKRNERFLLRIFECLSLSESLYRMAIFRYKHLKGWLTARKNLYPYKPQIFLQGSFKLGTAIHPVQKRFGFDIDLFCALSDRNRTKKFTERGLKTFIGCNLEKYVSANGIQAEVIAKKRCWRIKRLHEESFYMDIVPVIADINHPNRQFITDLENMDDSLFDDKWLTSNPTAYSYWFLKQCYQESKFLSFDENVSRLPQFKDKFILQKVVMILKRHCEIWACDFPKRKTASIIITTLAAREYRGESSIGMALHNIILRITKKRRDLLNLQVVNPRNRYENFADRWTRSNYKYFELWIKDLYIDFIPNFFRSQRKDRYRILILNLGLYHRYNRLINRIH